MFICDFHTIQYQVGIRALNLKPCFFMDVVCKNLRGKSMVLELEVHGLGIDEMRRQL
jgi:hypothetical protein